MNQRLIQGRERLSGPLGSEKDYLFFSPYFFEVPLLKYNLPLKIISLGVYYLD